MINGKKAKELDIKPERVRELVIEIENQGKINLKEIQIYNGGKNGTNKKSERQ